jgi:hypothetical protein
MMKKKYHYYLEEAHKINFNEGWKKVALGATILGNEQLRQKRLREEEKSETKNQENKNKARQARQDSENRRNAKIERKHEEKYDADYDIIKKNFKNGEFLNNINLEPLLFHNKYPSNEIKTIKGTKEVDEIINNFNTKINNLFNQLSKIYSNVTKNGKTTTPEEKIESMKKSIDFELTNIFSDLQFTDVKPESKKRIVEKILYKWKKTEGKIHFNNLTIELEENKNFIEKIIATNYGPRSNNCDSFGRHLHSSLIFHPSLLTFEQFNSLVDDAKKSNTLDDLFMPIDSKNQRALGLNDYKDGISDFKKISEIFQKIKNNKDFDKIVELMKKCETELGI